MKRHLIVHSVNILAVMAALLPALLQKPDAAGIPSSYTASAAACLASLIMLIYSKGLSVLLSYVGVMILCYGQPCSVTVAAMCVYGFVANIYRSDRISKAAHVVSATVLLAAGLSLSVMAEAGVITISVSPCPEIIPATAACLQLLVIARVQWVRTGNMKTVIGITKAKSETDVLTGLSNRQNMSRFIAEQAGYASVFSLMMCDIDHFKRINDTFGHEEGDLILKRLSELIQATIRKTDVAFRFGGEEFVIVLPKTTVENAYRLAERIRLEFQKMPYQNGDRLEHFTISIGVAECRYGDFLAEDGEEDNEENRVKALIKKADSALYKAKESGRNRTVRY